LSPAHERGKGKRDPGQRRTSRILPRSSAVSEPHRRSVLLRPWSPGRGARRGADVYASSGPARRRSVLDVVRAVWRW